MRQVLEAWQTTQRVGQAFLPVLCRLKGPGQTGMSVLQKPD